MENIELDYKEMIKLINKEFNQGAEAFIYGPYEGFLFKIFTKSTYGFQHGIMNDNKYRKLKYLKENNIKHIVLPEKTISYDNQLIGYTMPYNKKNKVLDKIFLTKEEKINVLKQIKDILVYLNENKIVYGDIAARNILVNKETHEAKFCDVDNMKVNNMKFDIINNVLNKFVETNPKSTENIDAYMFNLLTIQQLFYNSNYTFNDIYYDLRSIMEEKKFNDDMKKITYEMIHNNFKGDYLINHIK